jgi:DNA polymerase-4
MDDRPVIASRAEKSISNEQTYDNDLCDRQAMERQLLRLAERTAGRLRKAALCAGTVQVKIRRSDFKTFTRQKRLQPPGNSTDQIYALARELLSGWLSGDPDARIRLLGVGCSSLSRSEQPDLFGNRDATQATDFDRAIDEIRDRFGSAAVSRARTLDRP